MDKHDVLANSTQTTLYPGNVTYAHLNVQSLIPKWDEVSDFLATAPCSLILGLIKQILTERLSH